MIDRLEIESASPLQLQAYLNANFREVFDYFNHEKHSIILNQRTEIDRYLLLKIPIFRQLDITNETNLAFLTLLLNLSERFEFRGAFKSLYNILKVQNYDFGQRLEASALYLIDINTAEDYLNRFDDIYNRLQLAFETEEDSEDKVLTSLINYYGQVVYNFEFNPQVANNLKDKILQRKAENIHSFLNHPLIETVLNVPIVPHDTAFQQIHQYLDAFLGRDIIRIFSKDIYLIEEKTQYSLLVSKADPVFNEIRDISRKLYLPVQNDTIFHSLQRGVKILEDENQLFAYMYSYGNMHHAKLISAFETLPAEFFNKTIRIIDWGCGQGMGTMAYLDFLKSKHLPQDIRHITLIEPSEIALKRASLHAAKFVGGNNILTINKDLDALLAEDLKNSIPVAKLHIFSNILDIELFSMSDLIDKISSTYTGENFFICVSPYVTDSKTNRIDSFVNSFAVKNNEFELICSVNNKKGSWIRDWARVIRVFKSRI